MQNIIERNIKEVADAVNLLQQEVKSIERIAKAIIGCYKNKNKVLIMGNGGSAADAQHWTGELMGWYLHKKRKGLFAVALHADSSSMTAIANDTSYNEVYRRQVQASVKPGDVVIGITTSGNSQNILWALQEAKKLGAVTIGLTGKSGGKIKEIVDIVFCAPTGITPIIQTCHQICYHTVCEIVEKELFGDPLDVNA